MYLQAGSRVLLSCLALLAALFAGCGARQRPDGGTGYLPVGAEVPALTGSDQLDRRVELRAKIPTLLYFFPRSGTPGCTKEACAFRDAWKSYSTAGVRVIGVSSDAKERQQEFAREHSLPFALISDPDHVWSDALGVGTFMGFDSRVSFLVDANGRVARMYQDVDPGVHAGEVLADVKKLGLVGAADAPAEEASR